MSDDHEMEQALRAALRRGDAFISKIFAEPSMLELEEFAARSRMTKGEVEGLCRQGELLVLEDRRGTSKLPEWQLGPDGRPLPAIRHLLAILEDKWAVYRFLMQHHPELDGQTGLDAIRAGKSVQAIATAQSLEISAFS